MSGGYSDFFIIAIIVFLLSTFCVLCYFRTCKKRTPAQPTNTWQPVPQQPPQNRSFFNFGNLSTHPRNSQTTSYFNSTNSGTTYSGGNSRVLASSGLQSAAQSYNILITPSAPQLNNIPSESHGHNIPLQNTPTAPEAQNSAAVEDQPPDYNTVVLADSASGNEQSQYPSVIEGE